MTLHKNVILTPQSSGLLSGLTALGQHQNSLLGWKLPRIPRATGVRISHNLPGRIVGRLSLTIELLPYITHFAI